MVGDIVVVVVSSSDDSDAMVGLSRQGCEAHDQPPGAGWRPKQCKGEQLSSEVCCVPCDQQTSLLHVVIIDA